MVSDKMMFSGFPSPVLIAGFLISSSKSKGFFRTYRIMSLCNVSTSERNDEFFWCTIYFQLSSIFNCRKKQLNATEPMYDSISLRHLWTHSLKSVKQACVIIAFTFYLNELCVISTWINEFNEGELMAGFFPGGWELPERAFLVW